MRIYGWLDYRSFEFRSEQWTTQQIVDTVRSGNEPAVESWKNGLLITGRRSHRSLPLAQHMINHGTWPVPPLVFDNRDQLAEPDGNLLSRYRLLEGHHRLGYLRAMHESAEFSPSLEHKLWLATGRPLHT